MRSPRGLEAARCPDTASLAYFKLNWTSYRDRGREIQNLIIEISKRCRYTTTGAALFCVGSGDADTSAASIDSPIFAAIAKHGDFVAIPISAGSREYDLLATSDEQLRSRPV